jgi:hypothetical protein
LHALRVLHCNLPDLCPARRRTRQSARPHLLDQRHAGGQRAGYRRYRQAHRPVPLLPVLHDNVPVRRQLHAPRRPRTALDRRELPPAMGRAHIAAVSRRRSVATSTVSALAALRGRRQAAFEFSTRASRSAFWVGTHLDPACLVDRSAERVPSHRRAANAGRAVAGMRPKGTGPRNQ